MSHRPYKRLFHSVFTKLLVIILATGMAITVTVLVGFSIIRFQSVTHLDRNLTLYSEYIKKDLGNPPNFERANDIAQQTGMAIRFDHPDRGWKTDTFPKEIPLEKAWLRQHDTDIWIGRLRGHTFIRIQHGGGNLIFITSHWATNQENAKKIFLGMGTFLVFILGLAYFAIRKILRPLRTLKTGAETLGKGELDHRVPQTGHDEFRDLSEAFNDMAGRLSLLLRNKERLLLDVSHELRSPITRLKVLLELIQDEESRKNLRAEVMEMETMVSAILEEARLRNSSASLELAPTDINQLTQSVVADFKNIPPGVVYNACESTPILVDREKIRMVLRNLIDNAVKHSSEDGQPVIVTLNRVENTISIEVEDRGAGIAETDLPHVFDPFFRTDSSRSRRTGGYGLGLSLCKAVLDAHNGMIHITSRIGQGTKVVITLSIREEHHQ